MAWTPEMLKRYEAKFTVGQFVDLDIPEIPPEQRDTTWGIIVDVHTRFPLSPEYRRICYTIKLAANYIKKEFMILKGLRGVITITEESQMKLIKNEVFFYEKEQNE